MKKFNYVYLTTNIVNGKQYVGDHSTNNLNENYYIGSGQILKDAIKKYGRNNFKKDVLEYFETKQEAFTAQEKYIQQFNTLVPNGYNISPKGGICVKGCFSEESLNKIRNHRHTAETIELIRKTHLGKKQTPEHIAKRNKKGRNVSAETCKKISDGQKGRKAWNKGLTRKTDERVNKYSQKLEKH